MGGDAFLGSAEAPVRAEGGKWKLLVFAPRELVEQVMAVDDFFQEILRDVIVMVGGFEADPGIEGLDFVHFSGECDF